MAKSIHTKEYKKMIERMRKARLELGLKQTEVAQKLGRPQSYISKIESRERRIDITELKQFANIYKKDIDYFVNE